MKIENKIAIGCIVQWYEVEIAGFYVDSLLQAIESIDNQENIIVDFCFYMSENFEPIDTQQMTMGKVLDRFRDMEDRLRKTNVHCNVEYYSNVWFIRG